MRLNVISVDLDYKVCGCLLIRQIYEGRFAGGKEDCSCNMAKEGIEADNVQVEINGEAQKLKEGKCSWFTRNKKEYLLGIALIAGVCIASAAIIIGVELTKIPPTTEPTTTETPPHVPPSARIDCYPEAQGGVETVDQSTCVARQCLYDPNTHPNCYMNTSASWGKGYKVTGDRNNFQYGFRYELEPAQPDSTGSPYNSTPFGRPMFEVEERSTDILHFKVFYTVLASLVL